MQRTIIVLLFILFSIKTGYTQQHKTQQIDILLLNANYEEVIKKFHQDNSAPIQYKLGLAYNALFQYTKANQAFYMAYKENSQNLNYATAYAKNLVKLGDYRKAISLYTKLHKTSPENTAIQQQLASLQVKTAKYGAAIKLYEKLLRQDTTNFFYYKQLGNCYSELNKDLNAINNYILAYHLNNRDISLVPKIANLHLKSKRLDKAFKICTDGIKIDPENTKILRLAAYVQFLNTDYESAILNFHKSLELGDTTVFALKYLGISYHDHKKYEKARRFLSKAYELDDKDPEISLYFAKALSKDYHKKEALKQFKTSISLLNPSPRVMSDLYKEMADIYYYMDDSKNEIACFEKIIEVDPKSKFPYYYLGRAYDRTEDKKIEAVQCYEKFLDAFEYTAEKAAKDDPEKTGQMKTTYWVYQRVQSLRKDLHFEDKLDKLGQTP